ncbi:OmpH family outer membrane protein [Sphingomonas sp. PAMC26645]|uniref:OmpH family outer membrane protein n=1 Tax=Sphingomonas sp. PAMC26645 TaxID=2565555 RepID=UPI00109E1EFD|nr:OmpH family outer membrane protein [Sphingomonas sp. PAMC26645]QCB43998.1 OmpH family outer membrane protein [Sphingomonas sp. PAMC26645]
MTTFKTLLLAAALVAPAAMTATAADAQVSGIAVADAQGAIANSKAWNAARAQIETTYKAQLDQAETRRQAVARELQPLVTAFQTAQRAPGATDASLRPQAQAIQTRETAANQELARLTQPAQRAQQYAIEQIQAKLSDAVTAAVRAKNVSLLLRPEAALFAQPTADITPAITTELDRLVPSVSTAVPANWQPNQQGGQQQPGAAPAPAGRSPAATRTPQGR